MHGQELLCAYNKCMPKRSRKQTEHLSLLDKPIVEAVTKEPKEDTPQKNPAAVALGRLGGLKGGRARAQKLSAKRRKEIAQKAARVRWTKK